MRFLRSLLNTAAKTKTKTTAPAPAPSAKRQFAHVHDIHIKWVRPPVSQDLEPDEQVRESSDGGAASMERNGMFPMTSLFYFGFLPGRRNTLPRAGYNCRGEGWKMLFRGCLVAFAVFG